MQEYVPGENLILLFVQTFGIYDFRLTIHDFKLLLKQLPKYYIYNISIIQS
jgi:hypothetical protein